MPDTDTDTVTTAPAPAVTAAAPPGCPVQPLHRLAFPPAAPPRRSTLPNGTPVWLVTRYGEVQQVLTDPRFKRSLLYAADAPPLTDTPNMANNPDVVFNLDDAEHLRLRRTVQRVFTPRGVARLRPWVASTADQLLDRLVERGSPADLVADYTMPLPVAVMGRLMGLEELTYDRLRYWAEHAVSDTTRQTDEVADVMKECFEFSADLLARRRRTPGDDLISTLAQAADQEGGVPERQLTYLVAGLMVGGYDTTMTMLGNALLYVLGERPEVWARLGSDEEGAARLAERLMHLIPLGRNEEKPGSIRRAAEDVEIGGERIRAGDLVAADTFAANRDPAVFADRPFDDLFAPLESPTLALGAGRHHCLGAWLARAELQLALHKLAARLPELRLTVAMPDVQWRLRTTLRSPLSLPVAW